MRQRLEEATCAPRHPHSHTHTHTSFNRRSIFSTFKKAAKRRASTRKSGSLRVSRPSLPVKMQKLEARGPTGSPLPSSLS